MCSPWSVFGYLGHITCTYVVCLWNAGCVQGDFVLASWQVALSTPCTVHVPLKLRLRCCNVRRLLIDCHVLMQAFLAVMLAHTAAVVCTLWHAGYAESPAAAQCVASSCTSHTPPFSGCLHSSSTQSAVCWFLIWDIHSCAASHTAGGGVSGWHGTK
jgi:hypothetical protein